MNPDEFTELDPKTIFKLSEEKKMAYFLTLLSKRTLELLPSCVNKETGFVNMQELFSHMNAYGDALIRRYKGCSSQIVTAGAQYVADFKRKMKEHEDAKTQK